MTDNLREATSDEIERAKTDPLFIMLILRQRMRNEKAFLPGAHRMSLAVDNLPGLHHHAHNIMNQDAPRSIQVSESELEILLTHFEQAAADKHRLAANLNILDDELTKAHAEISELRARAFTEGEPVLYRWWFESKPDQVNIIQPDLVDTLVRKPGLVVEALAPVRNMEKEKTQP